MSSEKQREPAPNKVGLGCLLTAVLLIGGCGALIAVGGDDDDASGQVKVACRDWVRDRLKSPSSAKFSGESVRRSGTSYTVTGAVDSQNSFGAMIRNDFTCETTNSGGETRLLGITGIR